MSGLLCYHEGAFLVSPMTYCFLLTWLIFPGGIEACQNPPQHFSLCFNNSPKHMELFRISMCSGVFNKTSFQLMIPVS